MKTILLILICFIGITSATSGLLIMTNPEGSILNLHPDLLTGTPFKGFVLPGLLLAVLVGGTNILAVFFNMQRHPNRYNWALAGGVVISIWIIVQMIMINTVHWLHFIYLGAGLIASLIALQLKGKALI